VILPAQLEEKCANGAGCAWLIAQHKIHSEAAEVGSLVDRGRYKEAETKADALVTFSERHWGPDSAYTAAALEQRRGVSASLGRVVEAEEFERRALANYETVLGPEHPHVGAALDSLGDIYAFESRKADAEQYYKKSLAVYENNANVWHEVGLIAEDWFWRGWYAGGNYQIDMSGWESSKLAGFYKDEGRADDAREMYRHAVDIYQERMSHPIYKYWGATWDATSNMKTNRGNYAYALWQFASFEKAQGHYSDAESLYQRAIAQQQQAIEHRSLYSLTDQQTQHYELNVKGQLPQMIAGSAELYHKEGQYTKAEATYREALDLYAHFLAELGYPDYLGKSEFKYELARTLQWEGKLAEACPLYEEARQHYLSYRGIRADVRDEAFKSWSKSETEFLSDYGKLLSDLALRGQAVSGCSDPTYRAFTVFDELRGTQAQSSLSQAEARAVARDPTRAGLAQKVQSLRTQRDALAKVMAAGPASSIANSKTGFASIMGLDRDLDEATEKLLKEYPDYAELTAPDPIDYSGVQLLLEPREVLIAYTTLDDRVLVWLVKPGSPITYRNSPIRQSDLAAMIKRLRDSLAIDRPFDVSDARKLYSLLLEPFVHDLRDARQLILVPDQILLQVPFVALLSDEAGPYHELDAEYQKQFAPSRLELEHDYSRLSWVAKSGVALSILPSATSLRALRGRQRNKPVQLAAVEPFIGVGDPVLEGTGNMRGGSMVASRGADAVSEIRKLPRLAGARDELIAEANALHANPDRDLFLAERATKTNIEQLNENRLANTRVIAFATHALIGGEFKGLKEPALVLTPPAVPTDDDNGLLAIDDILRLRLDNAQWVILSACNTASPDGSGQGFSGLARAFFYAGAPALLVSQWSVDDAATRQLMAHVLVYYATHPGSSRAEALRSGMLASMDGARGENAYFAHPFAWAPFVVVGEP